MPEINIPQAKFLQLPHKFKAYVGGYGCVHPNTRIHTEHGVMRICDIDRPMRVLSWNEKNQQFQLSLSGGSFPKGKANLYRVSTRQGEFVSTGHHRIFSSSGIYQRVDSLSVGDDLISSCQSLPLTNLVDYLLSFPSDDLHCNQTISNSMGSYASAARQYGQRLLKDQDTVQSYFPQQVYAPISCLYSCLANSVLEGVRLALKSVHSHLSLLFSRAYKTGYLAQFLLPVCASEGHTSALPFEHIFDYHSLYPQSPKTLKSHCKQILSYLLSHSSYSPKLLQNQIITQVDSIGEEVYYDMQVAETNNYIDEYGFIHHNSGKTYAGCFGMCDKFYRYPGINQGYFAPTYPHIRDIFYPTIEEVAYMMNMTVTIREANKEVHFFRGGRSTGTTICRSMDRPGSIIGFKIGNGMVDELDTMPAQKAQDAWRKIIARLRWENAPNGCDVTTTPEGFGETHRLFVENLIDKPDLNKTYGIVQASTRDNEKNLPEGYIQSLIDTYPAELIDAYIDGQFCILTSGTVYRSYNRVTHNSDVELDITKDPVLRVGMDFNVTQMAATIYTVRDGIWHAVDELKEVFDTPTMVGIIKDRYPGFKVVVYPDATGNSRDSNDASRSDFGVIQQAGFAIKANSTNPRVKDRIMSVNKAFESGKLKVNAKKCPTVARNLEKQAYDKNGEPDKSNGFDHQCDSVGYPIVYEFPIVRPMSRIKLGGY